MRRWGGFCEKRCRVVLFLLAYCLSPLASCPGDARADHLTPKHDPWAQPWELERLALLDVPEGMVPVPGGPFLMGSDPKVDRAAGPQEFRSSPSPSMLLRSIGMKSPTSIIFDSCWPQVRPGRRFGCRTRFSKRWPHIRSSG